MDTSILIRSLLGGLLATAAFSITTPATKVAVHDFSPLAVTGIRGLIAGLFCLGYLLLKRRPLPDRRTMVQLFVIAAIGSCGFAGFLALALQTVPAVHASVFLAILPLLTAVLSQFLMPEPVSVLFWIGAGLGGLISGSYLAANSYGDLAVGDLFLFLAMLCAAWGYVFGARHSRKLGGATTMSWIVVLGSPLYLTLLILGKPDFTHAIAPSSIVALVYLGTVSQSLGMFLWFWCLSTGYSALVAQTQIIQPFLSMFAAALLLGETVQAKVLWVTAAVIASVGLATFARIRAARSIISIPKTKN